MVRFSQKEYIELMMKRKSSSKYNNQKTNWYDSKKECDRAFQLECLEKAWIISDLKKQVTFVLQEWYIKKTWELIRPITYKADFTYIKEWKMIIEDVKWVKTEVYKIKKKLFEYRYPDMEIKET